MWGYVTQILEFWDPPWYLANGWS